MSRINTIIASALLLFTSSYLYAQNTVSASEIIEKVRNGESISYENVTVSGDLDFTFYFEKKHDDKYSRKSSFWKGGDNAVEEIIRSRISFVNCKFNDDVLAYINDDYTDFTFTASFDNGVVFKNCEFNRKSAFKYSTFEGETDFSGSDFDEEALFKYAKFEEYADFHEVNFSDDANFKYAKFRSGLDFSNATFREDLNLKYAKIDGDFKSDHMDIQEDLDVKYTEINGQSFSKYLLKSR